MDNNARIQRNYRHVAVKAKIRDQIQYNHGRDLDEEIADDKRLAEDLCFDSLDCVELLMKLEELFDIEIADEQAKKWITVKDILDYVDGKMEQK